MENDVDVLCYVKPDDDPNRQWKIALAQGMILPTIKWFHQILGHPGNKRMRLTLQARYYHPELRRHIDRFSCEACQRHKLDGRGFGLLPERSISSEQPWQNVAIDLIGPWNPNQQSYVRVQCSDVYRHSDQYHGAGQN